VVKFSRRSCQ